MSASTVLLHTRRTPTMAPVDCVIIGAGLAGLQAARRLSDEGVSGERLFLPPLQRKDEKENQPLTTQYPSDFACRRRRRSLVQLCARASLIRVTRVAVAFPFLFALTAIEPEFARSIHPPLPSHRSCRARGWRPSRRSSLSGAKYPTPQPTSTSNHASYLFFLFVKDFNTELNARHPRAECSLSSR